MGITADIAYSKAKKLVAGIQSGFDHATETKNADGTVTMTMYFTNGTNVPLTFPKPNDGEKGDDGASVVSASVKNKHLILTKDDGTDIDCGLLPTSDYDDTELRTAIDGKVDKVTGKSLVDDAEIARLANVDNYDDTAIKATIKTVSDGLMASAGYSADYKTIDIVTVGGDKKSIDVKPVIEHANIGELADVDSTNKGNGKALVFNEATGKHEYSASSGTDELVKMDASGDAKYLGDLLDKVTVVNESGVLKVKKLDGQEVTIEEINYLKGLTMNVMDLVNLFANGGVKIINTPVSTYADLLAYDKSALIEGISYLIYVLDDENYDGAKTTYLIDKDSSAPTYFGFADSHRDFTTNPIDLASEITGKLGVGNIDIDALSALLTVNVDDTYKTLTTTSNSFGTHGAKALYDELVQAIGLKANTSDLTSHTGDTYIHVNTTDKEKWNKVVAKADQTDLDAHTTDTNIHVTSSDKTKWDEAQANVIETVKVNGTKLETTDKAINVTVPTKVSDLNNDSKFIGVNTSNITADVINNSFTASRNYFIIQSLASELGLPTNPTSAWYLQHLSHTNGFKYPTQIAVEYAGAERIFTRFCVNGVWGDWIKVCTTKVADVPLTNLTSENSGLEFTNLDSSFQYYVKNGICYVNVWSIKSTVSGSEIVLTTKIPVPAIRQVHPVHTNEIPYSVVGQLHTSGSSIKINIPAVFERGYCSFSYPVAES